MQNRKLITAFFGFVAAVFLAGYSQQNPDTVNIGDTIANLDAGAMPTGHCEEFQRNSVVRKFDW